VCVDLETQWKKIDIRTEKQKTKSRKENMLTRSQKQKDAKKSKVKCNQENIGNQTSKIIVLVIFLWNTNNIDNQTKTNTTELTNLAISHNHQPTFINEHHQQSQLKEHKAHNKCTGNQINTQQIHHKYTRNTYKKYHHWIPTCAREVVECPSCGATCAGRRVNASSLGFPYPYPRSCFQEQQQTGNEK